MSPALRNKASVRLVQSFSATTPNITPTVVGARSLSISGPREATALSTFESAVANIPRRSDITPSGNTYNTSRTMKQVNDSSTVDFAYIPTMSFAYPNEYNYGRIPLLPDNYMIQHKDTSPEPHVARAEISTATLSDAVATVTEAEISKAADVLGLHSPGSGQPSTVRHVWNGILDDVFGSKKVANI